jgi:hypothetical protein
MTDAELLDTLREVRARRRTPVARKSSASSSGAQIDMTNLLASMSPEDASGLAAALEAMLGDDAGDEEEAAE